METNCFGHWREVNTACFERERVREKANCGVSWRAVSCKGMMALS